MSKKCSRCGAALSDTLKFCPTCGESTLDNPEATLPISEVELPQEKKPKQESLRLWIVIAAAMLVACLAAGAAWWLLSGGEDAEPKREEGGAQTVGQSGQNAEADAALPKETTKTIMIYIVGSDLESRSGAATLDIAEMLEADFDTDKTTVLLYTGGAGEWQNEVIDPNYNYIFRIEDGALVQEQQYPAANMGDANTLSSFITYGMSSYATDQYGLILWNHGSGPVVGYGFDEITGDLLLTEELFAALKASGLGGEKKLEFLGFDACLMGSIEVAWGVKDYANYFIASQETEPGEGWDYSFLKGLESQVNGEQVGRRIIDSYFAFYETKSGLNPYAQYELTLSCLNLQKIEPTLQALGAMFKNVNATLFQDAFPQVSQARYMTKSFAKTSGNFDYDLIDLTHIAELLKSDYAAFSSALITQLDELVVYSKANVSHAEGVSIYHPYRNRVYMQEWMELYRTIGFSADYIGYITNFVKLLNNESIGDWNTFYHENMITATDSGVISMQLTPEQARTYAGAKYYVFKKVDENEYVHVFSGTNTVLNESGVLSASYDGKAVFGVDHGTGATQETPLCIRQVHDGGGETRYVIPARFMAKTAAGSWIYTSVDWLVKLDNGEVQLLSAYESDASSPIAEKGLLDPSDYDYFQFLSGNYSIAEDENGKVKLEVKGLYGSEYSASTGFHLEQREITDMSDYYALFVVTDAQGNEYTSNFFSLGG